MPVTFPKIDKETLNTAEHTSVSQDWGTPERFITSSRAVLGTIDLDPASSHFDNKRVRATRIFTEYQDGLVQYWQDPDNSKNPVSIFMNPPGGKENNKSLSAMFWEKLMLFREMDKVLNHAIVFAFNMNQLSITQRNTYYGPSMCQFPVCILKDRVQFLCDDQFRLLERVKGKPKYYGEMKMKKVANSPPRNSAIVYVPGITNNTNTFVKKFSIYGDVINHLGYTKQVFA